MGIYETILKRRTIRKFKQEEIKIDVLKKLVNAARLAPQGANLQPLKYVIINDSSLLESIFSTTNWANYIKPAGNPKEGEKPVAYIAALIDTKIKQAGFDVDAGAAIENLILTASDEGIGTCWLGAIDREKIKEILHIPNEYQIHSLVALGYPSEDPTIEDESGSIKYYKDENGVLHVPKRKLEDILFYNKF